MGDTVEPRTAELFSRQVTLRSGLVVAQAGVGPYFLDFFAGGPVIAITFETAGLKIDRKDALRDGWGLSFLVKLGYSVLAVKPKRPDWYRGKELHQWFRSAATRAFLAGFDDRVFIGGSMGGFAAIAFSQIVPGALVIAHNPQSTLNPELVPWEPRFNEGREQDWSGDFAEAADAVPLARKIYVTYDPMHANDRRHVERLGQGNIVTLKMPFLGHETPEWLKQLGVLRESTEAALAETLTSATFAKMVRHRRSLPRYHTNALSLLRKNKHRDAVLFDAVKRFEFDPELYRDAVLRMFERRHDRKCRELYYGRLSLAQKLPASMQGVLRATVGMVEQRNDPGPHEPKLRKDRNTRMQELAGATNYHSINTRELLAAAKFLFSLKQWDKAAALAASALAIDPALAGAKKILTDARMKQTEAKAGTEPNLLQKLKRIFKNLW